MLLGLIFRQSAKQRRSIKAWRAGLEDTLPTHLPPATYLDRSITSASGRTYTSSTECEEKSSDLPDYANPGGVSRAGYGFGRQGEKAAGLKGLSSPLPVDSRE